MSQQPDTFLEPDAPERMPDAERSFLRGAAVTFGAVVLAGIIGIALLGSVAFLVLRLISPPEQVIERLASPDGKWELVAVESDHGALGGEVWIRLEPSAQGTGESRTVAIHGSWGTRPDLKWLDRDTFSIAGSEGDIGDDGVIYLD